MLGVIELMELRAPPRRGLRLCHDSANPHPAEATQRDEMKHTRQWRAELRGHVGVSRSHHPPSARPIQSSMSCRERHLFIDRGIN